MFYKKFRESGIILISGFDNRKRWSFYNGSVTISPPVSLIAEKDRVALRDSDNKIIWTRTCKKSKYNI